jgi:hypothetical protein
MTKYETLNRLPVERSICSILVLTWAGDKEPEDGSFKNSEMADVISILRSLSNRGLTRIEVLSLYFWSASKPGVASALGSNQTGNR